MCYTGKCEYEMSGYGFDGECDVFKKNKENGGKCPDYMVELMEGPVDEQLENDRLIYGASFEEQTKDGVRRRIDPMKVIMKTKNKQDEICEPCELCFEGDAKLHGDLYLCDKCWKKYYAQALEEVDKKKGEKNGLCNRKACLSPNDVVFYNKGTRKYYCCSCAQFINDANKDHPDTIRVIGEKLLCRTDEGLTPYEYSMEKFNRREAEE